MPIMPVSLLDLVHQEHQHNDGGFIDILYYADWNDIAVFPVIDNAVSRSVVTGPITMKPGKTFKKIYCTPGQGDLKFDGQGGIDHQSYKTTLSIEFPAVTAESIHFAETVKNGKMAFVVVQNATMDEKLLLFTKYFGCRLSKTGGGLGAKTSDSRTIPLACSGRIARIILSC